MPADIVREVVVHLRCPVCQKDLAKAWVTTLNKAFAPQVRAVERVPNAHVVAVGQAVDGRQLWYRCPEQLVRELSPGLNGPMGVKELEAYVARASAVPTAKAGKR